MVINSTLFTEMINIILAKFMVYIILYTNMYVSFFRLITLKHLNGLNWDFHTWSARVWRGNLSVLVSTVWWPCWNLAGILEFFGKIKIAHFKFQVHFGPFQILFTWWPSWILGNHFAILETKIKIAHHPKLFDF